MSENNRESIVIYHVHEHINQQHPKLVHAQRDLPARRQSNDDDTTAAAVKGGIIGAIIGVFAAIVIGSMLDD